MSGSSFNTGLQLDANTQDAIALTNIAGAIQWFNDDTTNRAVTRTLTNGTPGTVDHEDAHTVTVALAGYFFEDRCEWKPLHRMRRDCRSRDSCVTLRFRTANQPLNGSEYRMIWMLSILPRHLHRTLSLVAYPAGADISGTSSTGGTKVPALSTSAI
jgi:hypothetical protein